MNKLFKWLQEFWKGEDIREQLYEASLKYKVDVQEWTNGNAATLGTFHTTYDGALLLQHLKKFQIEMNEWACDVSKSDDEAVKRACIAYGVRLAHEKYLTMARMAKETKVQEVSADKLDAFFRNRMGMFKP